MNTEKMHCLLANTPDLLDTVYRIRHSCYLRSGAIAARGDGRFCDPFDALPNHFSFLLDNGIAGPVATVRISVVRPDFDWTDSPSRKVFGDLPSFQQIASESFVEASRLCFEQPARRDVFFKLVAHMAAMADRFDTPWLVACPRAEHSAIYQRLFHFRPLAAPRQYYGVNFLTELLVIGREELRARARSFREMHSAWADAATQAG